MNEAPSNKQSPALPLVLGVLGIVALVGAILLVLQLRGGVAELRSEYAKVATESVPAPKPEPAVDPSAEKQVDEKPSPAEAPADEPAAATEPTAAEPATAEPAAAEPEPSAEVAEEAAEPQAEPAEEPAVAEPTDASIGEGKWRFKVQHRPFTVSVAGENAIEDLAQMMLEDSESIAQVTGYNNPKFSSKAAASLARKVRGLIAQKGIEQYRVKTSADQLDDIEAFSIEIEFKTKGK